MSGKNLTIDVQDNVTCIFDGKETDGFIINEEEVLCISPEINTIGRVPFELHVTRHNSEAFPFTGIGIYTSGEL